MRVIDKKVCKIELLYDKLCTLKHTLIFKKFQNIAKKIAEKICEFAKKIYILFEVLYNWAKFRRLRWETLYNIVSKSALLLRKYHQR